MKKIMSIITVLLLAGSLAVAQSGKERKQAAEKKAAAERSRSMGGVRSGNEVKDDKGETKGTNNARQDDAQQQLTPDEGNESSNQPDASENLQDSNTSGDDGGNSGTDNAANSASDGNKDGNADNENATKSNAPVVIQRTTSESGSPSVLSKDNGQGRDGTNNVQRSSYNMAGAEVPGDMDLSRKTGSERNMNTGTKIRKQEEQPQKAATRQTQRDSKQTVNEQRRADEQAKSKSDDQKKNKSQKKNRRNKDRDSG